LTPAAVAAALQSGDPARIDAARDELERAGRATLETNRKIAATAIAADASSSTSSASAPGFASLARSQGREGHAQHGQGVRALKRAAIAAPQASIAAPSPKPRSAAEVATFRRLSELYESGELAGTSQGLEEIIRSAKGGRRAWARTFLVRVREQETTCRQALSRFPRGAPGGGAGAGRSRPRGPGRGRCLSSRP
jgi:hypothetical protein